MSNGVFTDEHFEVVLPLFFILYIRLFLVLWLLACLDGFLSAMIPSKEKIEAINKGGNGPHKLLQDDRPASLFFTEEFEDLMWSIHTTLLLLCPCIQLFFSNGRFSHPIIYIFTLDLLFLELVGICECNEFMASIGNHNLQLLHAYEVFLAI